jgi:hypothetical protein
MKTSDYGVLDVNLVGLSPYITSPGQQAIDQDAGKIQKMTRELINSI